MKSISAVTASTDFSDAGAHRRKQVRPARRNG